MRIFYFFLLLFFSAAAVRAQNDTYRFNRIDISKGLSHNTIRCFFKDNRGFVWIGTASGLNRFDGTRVKVFKNDPHDSLSISDNEIVKIFQDPDDRIWLNTWATCDIYDPAQETFFHHSNLVLKAYGIPAGRVSDIKKDEDGSYWFIHDLGIFRYSPALKITSRFSNIKNDSQTINASRVAAIDDDRKGSLWLIHENGVLEQLDKTSGKIKYRNKTLLNQYTEQGSTYNLMVDADGDVWIYLYNNNKGIFYFDSETKFIGHITKSGGPYRLNNDIVRGVVQDDEGIIWVATDHGGINLIDKKNGVVQYLLNNPDDECSLVQNSVNALYKDREGFIWAGTYKKGVSYYHKDLIRFQHHRHFTNNTSSLPFDDINCFEEDSHGNLWIGTNGGGLIYYDRAHNKYTSFVNEPGNEHSLSNNVIVSLCLDHDNKLWVGTFFGGLNYFDGKRFTRYKHLTSDSQSIVDDNIWEILEDNEGNLWIGTLNGGLDRFDRKTKSFIHYRNGAINSVHANYVPALVQDHDGNLWMGTGYGLQSLDRKTGKFAEYRYRPDDEKSIASNRVISLLEDRRGLLWIGTKEGLNVFNRKTNKFKLFVAGDGLSSNTIHTLLEDDAGNIWIGTPNGLSQLIPTFHKDLSVKSFIIRNYDTSDGLQGKQFNEGAAFKMSSGELIFGGANGFNIFKPESIDGDNRVSTIILTDFQLFNQYVKPNTLVNGKKVLATSIEKTPPIILTHNQNVFSIGFSTINFFHPEKTKFQYRLEGFNKDWLLADAQPGKITYTNLDAGDYTFVMRTSGSDGSWNKPGVHMNIQVLPPFWKSKIAFAIYAIIALGALFLARQILIQRERLKFQVEQERLEAQRVQELDLMKTKFFTNVSHEFRTPLTLILTPLEKLLKHTPEGALSKQLQLIARNARRLLNLVNQLLDLRRIEVQEIRFNPSEGDIIKFIQEAVFSFSDMAEKKNIVLKFDSAVEKLETLFDHDKLERILFNLLSNAFKFTPEDGIVSVTVSNEAGDLNTLQIRVKDTGIGILPDKQEKVFERFFQSDTPKTIVNQGSGIGLSITKEFVKIQGGSITLVSEPGKGSCFTVVLPIQKLQPDNPVTSPIDDQHQGSSEKTKPVLLLVEDNDDFRFYLKDNLKSQYAIYEAANGKVGLQAAQQIIPDLIVSDIMMPVLNGVDMCRKIKSDPHISHIPIILLTARSAEEQKMEGYELGVEDYITKPFNFEILQSRIRNIIHRRELFHRDFRRQIEIKGSEINITSLDERLITNAIDLVEQHIGDADFSVEILSSELNMSRVHLYKKLVSLTGKSPLEFIRTIRLQRAAQLLEKSQLTVAEIAYQVGFNSPKYFSKYFKETYHMLPSAYAAQKLKENRRIDDK